MAQQQKIENKMVMKQRKEENVLDTGEASRLEFNHLGIFEQCQSHLQVINMATEYQLTLREEMRKFIKLERAVAQKKNFQAERLSSMIDAKSLKTNANCMPWLFESIQSLAHQLGMQAKSHYATTETLGKHCTNIQVFLDNHHQVMNSVHEGESNNAASSSSPNSMMPHTMPNGRSLSPRKVTTERRGSGASPMQTQDSSKWYISPPPLVHSKTRPQHPAMQNQLNELSDFLQANIKYEHIRKSRLTLDNRVEYLQMQHKSIVSQLDEAKATMNSLQDGGSWKLLHWSTQSKLEDLRSRQEFLNRQKSQTEEEMSHARMEMMEFDQHQRKEMEHILVIFAATKSRYESLLKQSVNVLKMAIGSDVCLPPILTSNCSKSNWETFEDTLDTKRGINASMGQTQTKNPSDYSTRPETSPLDRAHRMALRSKEASASTIRSSSVDPYMRSPDGIIKTTGDSPEMNRKVQNWDGAATDDTFPSYCDDSSISDGGYADDCRNPAASYTVDESKFPYVYKNAFKPSCKPSEQSRMYGDYLTTSSKKHKGISVPANKTNNHDMVEFQGELSLAEKIDEGTNTKTVTKNSGDNNCPDLIMSGGNDADDTDNDDDGDDKPTTDGSMVKKEQDEENKIRSYINKYLRKLGHKEPIGNETSSGQNVSVWKNTQLVHQDKSPITITVKKESKRKLRVCTVHPIATSPEREGFTILTSPSGFHSYFSECKLTCRQQSRTAISPNITDQYSTASFGAGDPESRVFEALRNSATSEANIDDGNIKRIQPASSSANDSSSPDTKTELNVTDSNEGLEPSEAGKDKPAGGQSGDKTEYIDYELQGKKYDNMEDPNCHELKSSDGNTEITRDGSPAMTPNLDSMEEHTMSSLVQKYQHDHTENEKEANVTTMHSLSEETPHKAYQKYMKSPSRYDDQPQKEKNDKSEDGSSEEASGNQSVTVINSIPTSGAIYAGDLMTMTSPHLSRKSPQSRLGDDSTIRTRGESSFPSNSLFTVITKGTKTVQFDINSLYYNNAAAKDDSDSETSSLSTSLTCSYSINDNLQHVPEVSCETRKSNSNNAGRIKSKKTVRKCVRFNEEVQYSPAVQDDGEDFDDDTYPMDEP